MARWIHRTDGAETLDTGKLRLSKSMRLLDTDLGQQLMGEPEVEVKESNMSENGYQGYKNYQTWAVALWISNEYNTYHHWQGRAKAIKDEVASGDCDNVPGYWTAEQAMQFLLADELKDDLVDTHPLAHTVTMYSDILTHALGQVDWEEVADSILEE